MDNRTAKLRLILSDVWNLVSKGILKKFHFEIPIKRHGHDSRYKHYVKITLQIVGKKKIKKIKVIELKGTKKIKFKSFTKVIPIKGKRDVTAIIIAIGLLDLDED